MYSQQNLELFLEYAPDAIVIINTQGEIVYLNLLAEKLFQYKREELYKQKIEILIPSRYHEHHIKHRTSFSKTGLARPMGHPGLDLFGKRKDGSEFRVEISLSPVLVENNEKLIISSIRNITDRIEMEQKLRESQGMFQRIFESSISGIMKLEEVVDREKNTVDFKFILINRRAEELMLKKRDNLIGKKILEEYPNVKNSPLFDAMVEVCRTGNTRTIEFHFTLVDVPKWYKANLLMMDSGLMISFDDISLRKEVQKRTEEQNVELENRVQDRTEKLSEANERLKGINDKLDKYAYMISHDLKAPLANIEGLVNFIQTDYQTKPIDKEGEELLDMIKARLSDMRNIIENVLQSAKDEIKNKEEVNIYDIAQEVIDTLIPPSHFHFFLQSTLPVVKYPRTSLKQIFQNLVSNAIKYMDKPQPLITISCHHYKDYYVICVTDNGRGIPPEKQKDIFQLFETAHGNQSQVDSHGIGLTIVKQLIEENGGKIWVDSQPGKETRFHFTIPKK